MYKRDPGPGAQGAQNMYIYIYIYVYIYMHTYVSMYAYVMGLAEMCQRAQAQGPRGPDTFDI